MISVFHLCIAGIHSILLFFAIIVIVIFFIFFFKQKTAYEMRISDWSSYVCSSDLQADAAHRDRAIFVAILFKLRLRRLGVFLVARFMLELLPDQIGRASCRERVCQYV